MARPKNNFYTLRLSEDETTVELIVTASSKERAIQLYEQIEQLLIELTRVDLELDWQDDNPDPS